MDIFWSDPVITKLPEFPMSPLGQLPSSVDFNPESPLVKLILAIAILVVGFLVAIVASAIAEGFFKRTSIDNKIAQWLTGSDSTSSPPVEKWIATAIFWLIAIFTLVGFFQFLKLDAVAAPLNNFLGQITTFIPKLAGAALLSAIAWGLATVSKILISRYMRSARLDDRLGQQVNNSPEGSNTLPLSEALANALYWFILLLFLPLVLDALGLQQALQPLQNLVNQLLSALPKIVKAGAIGAVGWLIAQTVRRILTNLLATAGADRLLPQFRSSQANGGQALSQVLGTVAYVLILIPTAIASLEALEIEAVSRPATAMLDQSLKYLPQIFVAGLILAVAYFFGQFARDIVTNILTSLGFNNILSWLGLPSLTGTPEANTTSESSDLERTVTLPKLTPSQLVGIVVLVGIMLVAVGTATDVLKIDALTKIVFGVLEVAGRVLSGVIVFAIGLYLANLAYGLIASSGSRQAKILGHTARISIVALISAMALKQIGIASNIVDLAFGLITGAIAVAIALAFGLGGRDIAAEQIRAWLDSFKRN
ncbi:mechanosensitive ion channel [Tumidithrix elongata RA019]|uniref:Mechanosensitive ion channel n=1 Tax=Tumidithrix elongata BACA0141 TaxID=2716417 RepID=A0AAW9Q6E4_9CYAN|nr:mechanosensitive ion channel [Tumidithrix elongata RA019]